MGLQTGAIPKGRAGRKATPLDDSTVKALVELFTKTPTIDVDGETRPNGASDGSEFDTKGKAVSQGRRYKLAVSAKINKTVRVTGFENANKKWQWSLYVPLSEQNSEPEQAAA